MARRGPPRKVTYFEPIPPCLARKWPPRLLYKSLS